MKAGPLIVLFGISGVGKSYLAHMIFLSRPDFLMLRAGSLLKEYLQSDPEQLRTSSRTVISTNQMLLSEAVRRARTGRWQKTVLLEAHSIIDNDRDVVNVPLEAIKNLGIAGIILIEEKPDRIKSQREADDRSRPTRSFNELEEQQKISSNVASNYAMALSVPMLKVSPRDVAASLQFIKKIELLSQQVK